MAARRSSHPQFEASLVHRIVVVFAMLGLCLSAGRLGADPLGDDHPTILTRFEPPPGFDRTILDDGSFSAWLRGLPLRPEGSLVHLYNGALKSRQDVHAAVVDMSLGERDL